MVARPAQGQCPVRLPRSACRKDSGPECRGSELNKHAQEQIQTADKTTTCQQRQTENKHLNHGVLRRKNPHLEGQIDCQYPESEEEAPPEKVSALARRCNRFIRATSVRGPRFFNMNRENAEFGWALIHSTTDFRSNLTTRSTDWASVWDSVVIVNGGTAALSVTD